MCLRSTGGEIEPSAQPPQNVGVEGAGPGEQLAACGDVVSGRERAGNGPAGRWELPGGDPWREIDAEALDMKPSATSRLSGAGPKAVSRMSVPAAAAAITPSPSSSRNAAKTDRAASGKGQPCVRGRARADRREGPDTPARTCARDRRTGRVSQRYLMACLLQPPPFRR